MITTTRKNHRARRGVDSAARMKEPPVTLVGEHLWLLANVSQRVDALVDAASQDRWPSRELRSLSEFCRAEVLRQTDDEERKLFQPSTSGQLRRLTRDHARLRHGADVLDEAAVGKRTRSTTELVAIARTLLVLLEHHCLVEEETLAAHPWTSYIPPVR